MSVGHENDGWENCLFSNWFPVFPTLTWLHREIITREMSPNTQCQAFLNIMVDSATHGLKAHSYPVT